MTLSSLNRTAIWDWSRTTQRQEGLHWKPRPEEAGAMKKKKPDSSMSPVGALTASTR